jgi:hypothetical protein
VVSVRFLLRGRGTVRASTGGERTARAAILTVLSLAALLALGPVTAGAATVTATWSARLGTAGTNGAATIRAYSGGTGSVTLALVRLPARATLTVVLSKGTCASVGSTVIRFPAISTTSTGAAARTSSLTASQVSLVRSATAGTGRIALRVGAVCGAFPANPFPSPTLAVVGPVATVFNWSTDRCEDLDIPDLPARAFRDAAGNVQLLAAHYINRRFIGPDLGSVKHDCSVIMQSAGDPNPADFSYHQWIASPYTTDGQTIYALVHDEYYGSSAYPPCLGINTGDPTCNYTALTLAVSTDAGASYHPAAPPPANLVASSPYRYEAAAGPYGFFNPSNIVKGRDGYSYATIHEFQYREPSTLQTVCMMRTPNVADPSSWRAWDGTGYTIAFADPYVDATTAASAHGCANIGILDQSLSFNTYLNRYVIVGGGALGIGGRTVFGVYYTFSDDLVHRSPMQLLFEAPLPQSSQPGDPHFYSYPSLIDPSSPSRNFDTSGQHAYVYLTRFNPLSGNSLNRDLIRVPVEFFPTAAAANTARVPFAP